MTFTRFCAAFAAFATVALLFAAPASAQATRTWVSGTGDDANPCSRTAPCKTFAGAISKTVAAGEIECMDPGGFGGVTITKSITINCLNDFGDGGVLVSGTNGIVVSGGTQVQLLGLDIDGVTTGLVGVLVNANTVNVLIKSSMIYEFNSASSTAGVGVRVTGTNAKVTIQDTIIRNNNAGISVAPASGGASVQLDHVLLDNNSTTAAGALSGNLLVASGGVAIIAGSTLTSASPAISNAGSVTSYGNNVIRGSITGTAITTSPLQ